MWALRGLTIISHVQVKIVKYKESAKNLLHCLPSTKNNVLSQYHIDRLKVKLISLWDASRYILLLLRRFRKGFPASLT